MFTFKPTSKTYSDPIAATFTPGVPFGRKYSKGDICLLHEGFQSSKIYLNSVVLRDAILNSKDYLEEILDITITDNKAPKSAKSKKVTAEDAVLSNEDLIVGSVKKTTKKKKEEVEVSVEVTEETTVEE